MIELYDFQIEALEQMHNGCILSGDTGSGKSITAIAYYFKRHKGKCWNCKRYISMRDPVDLYIITTARKRDTQEWEGELLPFRLSSKAEHNSYDVKVVVDSWNNIGKYVDVTNAFFIFDEQRVVGKGKWVKSFLKIAKNNAWILLSATPGDKWEDYIPVFVANGYYKNRTDFLRRHATVTWEGRYNKYPNIQVDTDEGRLIKLRRYILVDMDFLRPTQQHHEKVTVQYDKKNYRTVKAKRWNIYTDSPIVNVSELCYTMRKVVNSYPERAKVALDIAMEHKRSIIFYNFDYELEILHKTFNNIEGLSVAEWNGHKHQPIPRTEKWVYFVQYSAGSEGWNCIETDTVIFYSASYSYRTMKQASGRIDRLNTPYKDLYYYHIRSRAPIDMAIEHALRNKKKFNENRFVAGMGK